MTKRSDPQANATASPEPVEARPLLTAKEAAARLGVTAKALESWRGVGTGPVYIRLSGKFIRYKTEDLDAFVEMNRRHSTSQAR
jgi:predicted site-specific integrase-resolvase